MKKSTIIYGKHDIYSKAWKVVEKNGSFGDLDEKYDDFIQISINELNFIKHSLQATLIGTPINEMTFDSKKILDTCLQSTYTWRQLVILRDYQNHTAKATKCKVLVQKIGEPKSSLADN